MEWTEEESQRRRTDEVGAVVPEAARCRMGTVVGYRQFERKKDEMKERGDTRKEIITHADSISLSACWCVDCSLPSLSALYINPPPHRVSSMQEHSGTLELSIS